MLWVVVGVCVFCAFFFRAPGFCWFLLLTRVTSFAKGIPGAAAMGLQVCSLMWMRTIMNYQYRHGTTTREAARTLYAQGGIARFYRGIGPA